MDPNLSRVLANEDLREELLQRLSAKGALEAAGTRARSQEDLSNAFKGLAEGLESAADAELEAIVRAEGRPVLFIQDGKITDAPVDFWNALIAEARTRLEAVIPSIGRIEMRNHPSLPYAGTGWLIASDVVVTNRHVAKVFSRADKDTFVFRSNPEGRKIRARIDFFEEHARPKEQEFRVNDVLHIEDDDDVSPDIAFLRVDLRSQDNEPLPQPIPLADVDAVDGQVVGVVGYAAWDGFRNPGDVMGKIFGSVFNVKRLHSGEVMTVHDHFLNHDCSTLGGNSGSPVLDFASGKAVGLHYAGSFMDRNYAVKASTVRERLHALGIGGGVDA